MNGKLKLLLIQIKARISNGEDPKIVIVSYLLTDVEKSLIEKALSESK